MMLRVKKKKKTHMAFWKVYFYEVQVVNMNFGKYLILFQLNWFVFMQFINLYTDQNAETT